MKKSIHTWLKTHPLVIALIVLLVCTLVVQFVPTDGSYLQLAVPRLFLLLFSLAVIIVSGRAAILKFKDFDFAIKKGMYLIVIAVIFGIIGVASFMIQVYIGEASLSPATLSLLLSALILFAIVGAYEEMVFRGIIFDALLFRMGSSRKGVLGAMVLSSLVFGVVHIFSSLFAGEAINTEFVLQALGKTLSTAMFGFLLAAIYLKTRSIWGVAALHFLFDYLSSMGQILSGTAVSTIYVTADANADMRLILYAVQIVLSIPMIFIGWSIVRKLPLPVKTHFAGKTKSSRMR